MILRYLLIAFTLGIVVFWGVTVLDSDNLKKMAAEKMVEPIAIEHANNWLELVDAEKVEQSWQATAPMFKETVNLENWTETNTKVREKFGPVLNRQLKSTQLEKKLKEGPRGQYAILLYASETEKEPRTQETLVLKKSPQAQWQPVGYFVHKRPD